MSDLAPHIDTALLGRLMDEVSRFGATPGGGLCRLSADAEDGAARTWLRKTMTDAGFTVTVDRVGNMFGVLDLAGPDAPLVLAGSHLDSQPFGGRYDGAYGVVAAVAAALALGAAARGAGARPSRNVGVVNWTNEEGARFAPSTMGSAVFAGRLDADAALDARDAKGATLKDALAIIGFLGTDKPPANVAAYLEAHIEQGPHLERAGRTIGVVEGNWGTAKYEVEFTGRAAHTGPTPMVERRDALLPAAELILLVRALSDGTGGKLLSSVGRMDVSPNSTNVVPEKARLFVEFRDIDGARLAGVCDKFEEKTRALARPGIALGLRRTVDRKPGEFDSSLRDLIAAEAAALGHQPMRLHTVAGHDAVALAPALPSAMLFVPSKDGVSHNEAEFTRPEHLLAGAQVLAQVLARLVFR
jgi:N-carbamoyl-L-amino-acid hydrolase